MKPLQFFLLGLCLAVSGTLAGCQSSPDSNEQMMPGLDSEIQMAVMKTLDARKTATAAVSTLEVNADQAKIDQVGHLKQGGLLVIVQLGEGQEGEYFALAGGQEFQCSQIAAEPTRLYCQGPELKQETNILQVYRSGQATAVYALEFDVPGPEVILEAP